MGSLDYGRDKTDAIVREVGTGLWERARAETPALLAKAILTAASANSIDAGYLRWVLVNDRKSWERLPGSGMLVAAQRLYLESNAREHGSTRHTLPTDAAGERRVSKALLDLVKWAKGPFSNAVSKMLVKVAGPAADKIKVAVLEEHGERYTTQQARGLILVELPLRVRDHPHWFRDSTTLRLLLQGVLG